MALVGKGIGLLGDAAKGLADVVDSRTFFHNTDAELSGLLEAKPSRTGSGIFGLEKAGANYGSTSIPFKVRGKIAGPDVDDNLNKITKEITGSNVSDYSSEGLYEHLLGFVPEQEVQAIFKQAGYGARSRKSKGVDVVQAFGSDDVMQMDTPSRMARATEQGFDTDLYHKTWGENFGDGSEFTEFSKDKMQDSDYGYAGKGVYTTPKPLGGTTYGNTTMPLKAKLENPYRRNNDNWRDELDPYQWIPANAERLGGDSQASSKWTEMMSENGYDGFIDEIGGDFGEVVIFDPKNIRSTNAAFDPAKTGSSNLLASNPVATAGAGLLGLGAAAQSNDTYADYSPSNLARLQNDDVGSYQAAQSPQLARAAGLMGQVNKRGVDDPLMGFVAPRIPSELMDKIAYNDRRGITDYLKASAGLIGLY